MVKLKSEYTLILKAINDYKTKQILLNESNQIDSLDEASENTQNEKLFTKVLEMPILSTTTTAKNVANWIKISSDKYSFVVSTDLIVDFAFEDSNFKCISEQNICNELY